MIKKLITQIVILHKVKCKKRKILFLFIDQSYYTATITNNSLIDCIKQYTTRKFLNNDQYFSD